MLIARPKRPPLTPLALATAVCYAGCTICFVVATKFTTAANAILLQYSYPIWVALFSVWILRERPTRIDWIVIVVTGVGIGLFSADKLSADHLRGNLAALASGVFFGFMALLLRKQKEATPIDSIVLGTLLGSIVCLPWLVTAPALDVRAGLPWRCWAQCNWD